MKAVVGRKLEGEDGPPSTFVFGVNSLMLLAPALNLPHRCSRRCSVPREHPAISRRQKQERGGG